MNKIVLIFTLSILFSLAKAQDTLVISSANIHADDTILIYFPKYYKNSDKNFPLVYMLHGFGGDFHQVNDIISVQDYADNYGFIIATPDGLKDSWYFNDPNPKKMQWETFFVEELYPQLIKNYRVDDSNIFITGFSMGGYGSMYLFLRHNSLFRAAAASSGVLDLSYSGQKYLSLSDKLGEYEKSKDIFYNYSAINQLDSIKFSNKKIYIDCGNRDFLFEANQKFYSKCIDLYIDAQFLMMPGKHTSFYWQTSFPYEFSFFKSLTK